MISRASALLKGSKLFENCLIKNGFVTVMNSEFKYKFRLEGSEGITGVVPFSFLKKAIKAKNVIEDNYPFLSINGLKTTKIEEVPSKYRIDTYYWPDNFKELSQKDCDTIKAVSKFAERKDYLRQRLMGVYFENKNIVATNGHILAWRPTDIELENSFIVPYKYADQIFQGRLSYYENKVCIQNENESILFNTIDAKYPDYKSVIPEENPISVEITDLGTFTGHLKNADKVANPVTKLVSLNINSSLSIRAEDLDMNTEYDAVMDTGFTHKGDDLYIGFNLAYLLKCLDGLNKATIKMSSPANAVVINDNTLLMPIYIEI